MKIMKSFKTKIGTAPLLLLLALCVFLAGCAKLPNDGADAKVLRFDDLRDVRYAEVFLIGGDAVTHNLEAAFYNTTGLNNSEDPRNTCPEALWAKVDPEKLKKQYDVLGVFKNGPRHWTMDWIELPVGARHDFDGLKARWMGQVKLPKDIDLKKKGSSAYKPTTVGAQIANGLRERQTSFYPGRSGGQSLGHAGLLAHCGPHSDL